MKSIVVSESNILKFFDFFDNNQMFIINHYGYDDIDNHDKADKEEFEIQLAKFIESVFGKDCGKRLRYSQIFSFVDDVEANKTQKSVSWNKIQEINEALALLDEIEINDKRLTTRHLEKLVKFSDHLNLSVRQQIKIDEKTKIIDNKIQRVDVNFNKIDKKMEILNKSIDEQQKQLNKQSRDLQTSFMGILTIFTGVVFTLFGGLNILSQLFSRINNIAEPKELFGVLLIGVFFALLIYIVVVGLLLFAKRNTRETLDGYLRNILISGGIFIILFAGIGVTYFFAPYPQYESSQPEINQNIDESTEINSENNMS